MRNKRQVFVSLQHRSALFIRENRQCICYAAYHWGLLICPNNPKGSDCYAFDASDGILLDEISGVNLNPEGYWNFREKANINPQAINHLLGSVMIGKLPNDVALAEIRGLLESIPLPEQGAQSEQNCVTWTRAAICKLREKGLVEEFDLDRFMDDALAYADQRLHNFESTPASINYTGRPTSIVNWRMLNYGDKLENS